MGPLIFSVVFNAVSLDISGPQGGLCILHFLFAFLDMIMFASMGF